MTHIIVRDGLPYDFESIAVTATVIGLTTAKLSPNSAPPPTAALLTLETAAIRFRMDGVEPTTSEGHLMSSGDQLTLSSIDQLRKFRAIRDTNTSGVLKVTYLQ